MRIFGMNSRGFQFAGEDQRNGGGEQAGPPRRKASEFVRYVIADLNGQAFDITQADFASCAVFRDPNPMYGLLKQFISNEFGADSGEGAPPKHIEYMRRHELLDYCDVSEKGHYKWYPNGVLIQRLILDYAARLAREWGAFEMKNPLVVRGDHNVVGELMGEFHERDYRVDGGRGVCYLRYASDPLAFPFMQNVRFSHRQTPLKVYEEAICFRNEQGGEVSGLSRVRQFLMTDMHAACASPEEARGEFEALCLRFASLMNDVIAKGRWVLGWEGTEQFYEENKEWLIDLGRRMRVPAFFKLMPRMSHYYAIKNEFQAIAANGANVQVSTVQWDVKDGERFDIGYTDAQGAKHPCPVIIHASSFGSIERTLCAILENIAVDAAHGAKPTFPFWLAPTQARAIPVSDEFLPCAEDFYDRLTREEIRIDIDDRDDTVAKKIRAAEKEWVPYLLVIGEAERGSRRLSVRSRVDGKQRQMSMEEFVEETRRERRGMPFRPLALLPLLTRRPQFYG